MKNVMSETPKFPKAMQEKFSAIIGLAEPFCAQHLDEHYRKLIVEATAALCRKRPSPLLRGKESIWAAAIIHAIGTTNFLFDASQKPHCSASQIYEFFSTAASTSQNKSKEIRDMLDMNISNFKWMVPANLEKNPLVWMLQVNGLYMDIRTLPLEVQQEAFRRGMIPFMPPPL
jgi:hypothetical protein